MEKYINHDLELIQEEHELNGNFNKKARDLTFIDLSTTRNKNLLSRTSYKDTHDQKKTSEDARDSYLKTREYDRNSSL